ncbi:MAG: hypothetical protein AB1705_23630 [Verrucomicrobiota bacterium]
MKRTKLTPEEEAVWTHAFCYHLGDSKSDEEADELAWRDTVAEFPRLKEFDGASP